MGGHLPGGVPFRWSLRADLGKPGWVQIPLSRISGESFDLSVPLFPLLKIEAIVPTPKGCREG